MGLSGVDFYRPLTHDLVIKIFDDHDIKIRNLIIHGLKGSTILAELTVEKGGEIFSYDIRPSEFDLDCSTHPSSVMFFFLFKYSKEGISETGIPLLPKGRSLLPF